MKHILTMALVVGVAAGATAYAQTWPRFRGANSGLAADDPALPDRWSTSENVVWRTEIPGRGWSSPVVWGDHVFVVSAVDVAKPIDTLRPVREYIAGSLGGPMTGNDVNREQSEHRWVVFDISARTGAIRWERVLRTAPPAQPVHQKNSLASETPVTDGQRLYVYLSYAGLYTLDFDGKVVWSIPMDAQPMRMGWGAAASPALHNGRLYIVSDNEGESFLAAYDARTGDKLWRVPREERSSWSTPFVWQNSLRTEIVTTASKKVRSYDTNGQLLWELAGMTSIHAATPIAAGELLFISSGYPTDSVRPVYAIRPGASGDITLAPGQQSNAFIVWSHPTLAASYPSGLVAGDAYYMLLDRGILTATNALDEFTLATPAIANGSLFIRTATKLYRIARRPIRN